MKSQSAARLRSIGFGLHCFVLRFSWTLAFLTPLPKTTILRNSQLSTRLRPFFVSLSSAVGALDLAWIRFGLTSLRGSCASKVEDFAFSLTFPFCRPLTLTWIPRRLSICFWLVL